MSCCSSCGDAWSAPLHAPYTPPPPPRVALFWAGTYMTPGHVTRRNSDSRRATSVLLCTLPYSMTVHTPPYGFAKAHATAQCTHPAAQARSLRTHCTGGTGRRRLRRECEPERGMMAKPIDFCLLIFMRRIFIFGPQLEALCTLPSLGGIRPCPATSFGSRRGTVSLICWCDALAELIIHQELSWIISC